MARPLPISRPVCNAAQILLAPLPEPNVFVQQRVIYPFENGTAEYHAIVGELGETDAVAYLLVRGTYSRIAAHNGPSAGESSRV